MNNGRLEIGIGLNIVTTYSGNSLSSKIDGGTPDSNHSYTLDGMSPGDAVTITVDGGTL